MVQVGMSSSGAKLNGAFSVAGIVSPTAAAVIAAVVVVIRRFLRRGFRSRRLTGANLLIVWGCSRQAESCKSDERVCC